MVPVNFIISDKKVDERITDEPSPHVGYHTFIVST